MNISSKNKQTNKQTNKQKTTTTKKTKNKQNPLMFSRGIVYSASNLKSGFLRFILQLLF